MPRRQLCAVIEQAGKSTIVKAEVGLDGADDSTAELKEAGARCIRCRGKPLPRHASCYTHGPELNPKLNSKLNHRLNSCPDTRHVTPRAPCVFLCDHAPCSRVQSQTRRQRKA